jgi:hypothetical protein
VVAPIFRRACEGGCRGENAPAASLQITSGDWRNCVWRPCMASSSLVIPCLPVLAQFRGHLEPTQNQSFYYPCLDHRYEEPSVCSVTTGSAFPRCCSIACPLPRASQPPQPPLAAATMRAARPTAGASASGSQTAASARAPAGAAAAAARCCSAGRQQPGTSGPAMPQRQTGVSPARRRRQQLQLGAAAGGANLATDSAAQDRLVEVRGWGWVG